MRRIKAKNISTGRRLKISSPTTTTDSVYNEPRSRRSHQTKEAKEVANEEGEDVLHTEYFSTYIIESVAIKELHAAEDLNKICENCIQESTAGLEEWDGNEHNPSFSSSLTEINLTLNILQNKDKISFWTKGQNVFIMKLLIPLSAHSSKLSRKLERLSTMFQIIMSSLSSVLEEYAPATSARGSENDLAKVDENDSMSDSEEFPAEYTLSQGWHDRKGTLSSISNSWLNLTSKDSASVTGKAASPFKLFRKSIRNIFRSKRKLKSEETVEQSPEIHEIELSVPETINTDIFPGLESFVQNQPLDLQIPCAENEMSDVRATLNEIEQNQSSRASRQMAVLEPCSYEENEAGNGEAKELISEMNKQVLIDRILSEANAKFISQTQSEPDPRNPDPRINYGNIIYTDSSENEVSILHRSTEFGLGSENATTAMSLSPTPSEQVLTVYDLELQNDSNNNRTLIAIIEARISTLGNKVTIIIRNLREMEQTFYSLDSNPTTLSSPKEVQTIQHLVNTLKTTRKLFLEHPTVQDVMCKYLKNELREALSRLCLNGENCCRKLNDLALKVNEDNARLVDLVQLYQQGDPIVYEYSSNVGLNSFSNIQNV